MTAEEARPDWLQPGAKVVAYTTGGSGTVRNTVITTVDKVATKSFTIVGDPRRYRIDRMSSSYDKGAWSRTRHVVPFDTPEGRAEVAAEVARRAIRKAEVACETWMRDRTDEARLAAITALQAIQHNGKG